MDGVDKFDFKVLSLAIFTISTLMLFGTAQYASAGGCFGVPTGELRVTDGDATIQWTCEDLTEFSFKGVDHLDETEVHICVDDFGDCTDTDLDEDIDFNFALISATKDEDANTITLLYRQDFVDVEIVYTLTEISSTVAEVSHKYTITPEDGFSDEAVKFFHSTDADVNGEEDNTIHYDGNNKITFSDSDVFYEVFTKSFSVAGFDLDPKSNFVGICDTDTEGGDECELDGQPSDGHLTRNVNIEFFRSEPAAWDTSLEYDFTLDYLEDPVMIEVIERIILPTGRPTLPGSEMIMFSSGTVSELDGNDNKIDPRITFQIGPVSADFNDDIASVCNPGELPNAFIVPPFVADPNSILQRDWKEHLDVDSTAEYISTNPDGSANPGFANTALFHHAFTFDTEIFPVNKATLLFDYLSDNDLGTDSDFGAGPENIGLLLNCNPIPLSSMVSNSFILPDGERPFFTEDQSEGLFDITSLLEDGDNILQVYLVNKGFPAGIQYKASIGFDQCPPGEEPVEVEPELNGVAANNGEELPPEFECKKIPGPAGTTGNSGHEPPTIGKSLDGVRQVVDGGISVDDQTWTVTQGYHQEFELLQMLSSPHTISNVIHCAKGVLYCNYIAVGFMGLTDDFNNPVMTVSATKDHLGDWTLGWYDPDDYISDPGDATPTDITFVPQIIDDKLLGTSFTIDFKNKDTGQLKLGIQVRDSYNGVRNFFFNEGVEFIDADAYPAVETAYEAPLEVESLCFGQNNPDRNSCQFAKIKDWALLNAEETLRQMMGNQYEYEQ